LSLFDDGGNGRVEALVVVVVVAEVPISTWNYKECFEEKSASDIKAIKYIEYTSLLLL
jgi:hypothetical protein